MNECYRKQAIYYSYAYRITLLVIIHGIGHLSINLDQGVSDIAVDLFRG